MELMINIFFQNLKKIKKSSHLISSIVSMLILAIFFIYIGNVLVIQAMIFIDQFQKI